MIGQEGEEIKPFRRGPVDIGFRIVDNEWNMDSSEPVFARSALLTIDIQNDVLAGKPLPVTGVAAILPRVRLLLDVFRDAAWPVIHVVRIYLRDGGNVEPCRREAVRTGGGYLLAGGEGVQIASELFAVPPVLDQELLLSGAAQRFGENEWAMYKPRWGAFFATPLEDILRGRRVSTLVVTGCHFPHCVRTSIYEASERDFHVVLVKDAVSGWTGPGLEEIEGIGVRILTAAEVVERIRTAAEGKTMRRKNGS